MWNEFDVVLVSYAQSMGKTTGTWKDYRQFWNFCLLITSPFGPNGYQTYRIIHNPVGDGLHGYQRTYGNDWRYNLALSVILVWTYNIHGVSPVYLLRAGGKCLKSSICQVYRHQSDSGVLHSRSTVPHCGTIRHLDDLACVTVASRSG